MLLVSLVNATFDLSYRAFTFNLPEFILFSFFGHSRQFLKDLFQMAVARSVPLFGHAGFWRGFP